VKFFEVPEQAMKYVFGCQSILRISRKVSVGVERA
jgi:hypothetical protein